MRLSDTEKLDAIREIVNDVNPKLEEALKELAQWVPSEGFFPLEDVSKVVNGKGLYDDSTPAGELKDEHCPLLTEAFAYNLLGKEDARSLLGLFRQVVEAAGFSRNKIGEWQDVALITMHDRVKREKERAERKGKK